MANQRVKTIATPISEPEIAATFLSLVKELFNIDLNKNQLAVLIAHNNLETGHRNSMFNYNMGNITHVDNDGFDYWIHVDKHGKDIKISEQIKPGVWVPQTMKFRAYPSLRDGAKDYLLNLKKRGNGSVWQAMLQANPSSFSKALKQTNYYTANEEDRVDSKTGKIVPGYTSGMIGATNTVKNKDSYEKAIKNDFVAAQPVKTQPHSSDNQIANNKINLLDRVNFLLEKFLGSLANYEQYNKLNKTSSKGK